MKDAIKLDDGNGKIHYFCSLTHSKDSLSFMEVQG